MAAGSGLVRGACEGAAVYAVTHFIGRGIGAAGSAATNAIFVGARAAP